LIVNNTYVKFCLYIKQLNESFWFKLKEILLLKKEKECLQEELQKAQDTISRFKLEKSIKTIDIYEPNSPEVLHKKISKSLFFFYLLI
jgi:hypothetical protein